MGATAIFIGMADPPEVGQSVEVKFEAGTTTLVMAESTVLRHGPGRGAIIRFGTMQSTDKTVLERLVRVLSKGEVWGTARPAGGVRAD